MEELVDEAGARRDRIFNRRFNVILVTGVQVRGFFPPQNGEDLFSEKRLVK